MRVSTEIWAAMFLGLLIPQAARAQGPPTILTSTPPELRLWLKAEDLVTAGLQAGDPITPGVGWTDASFYGTNFAPRTNGFPFGALNPLGTGGPVEGQPHLEFTEINGNTVPVVQFQRQGAFLGTDPGCTSNPCQGNPSVDRSGSVDRLYQTNNLDDPFEPETTFDPLDIGNGENMVTFIVFKPEATTTPALDWQTVFAKRGLNAFNGDPVSVYDFKIDSRPSSASGGAAGNNAGRFSYVTIDDLAIYSSGSVAKENVFHITSLQVLDDPLDPTDPSNDTVVFFDDDSGDPGQRMSVMDDASGNVIYADQLGAVGDGPFTPLVPNTTVGRNGSAIGIPFGIGGHAQLPISGEAETFAGDIAEIIIFANDPSSPLSLEDFAEIEDYLNQKYFVPHDCDVDVDGDIDGADFLALQRNNPEKIPAWVSQYGSLSAIEAVPEPASFVVLSIVTLIGMNARQRQSTVTNSTRHLPRNRC